MNLIKRNWFLIILITVILVLLSDKLSTSTPAFRSSNYSYENSLAPKGSFSGLQKFSIPSFDSAAPTTSQDRMVVTETSLSLLVKDVPTNIEKIETIAKNNGGYMVNSSQNKPEFAATGTITVRVPEDKRELVLKEYKGLASKVVSENVYGNDVTDEYVDIETRLGILNKTKAKYEELLDKAITVTDTLSVQRELSSLQAQIDQLVGQQKYLEQTAKLSKITLYLSTDEISLPYYPDKSWRPVVVFKEAVRSLISTVRGLGNLLIWTAVYSPLLVLLLIAYWWYKKRQTYVKA